MTISLLNAIRNVTEEKSWIKKILILSFVSGLIWIVSYGINVEHSLEINLICWLVYFVLCCYTNGYILLSVNKTLNGDKFVLAEFFEKNIMLTGLKAICSYFLYGVVISTIFIVILLIAILILLLIAGLAHLLLVNVLQLDSQIFNVLGIIFAIIVTSFLSLYLGMFMNIAYVSYFQRIKFGDLFALDRHYLILKENHHKSWTLMGKIILYSLTLIIAMILCTVSIVGIILIPFVYTYAIFVMYNLMVQYAKEIDLKKYLEN